MPRVKVDHIVSFSSEDSGNPASNLLQWDISKKKWLCPRGEASCSVVLQLAKSTKISNVQVGAYQTALVEMLVGRSETPNDQYEVLVPSSIFLSPRDSRKEENVERVRSFGSEQFAEGARNQKWDRVRVVCSQPYNKHCKFGLSFIQIYEPESETKPASAVEQKATPVPSRLLATDNYSSDEDEFKPGQLFVSYSQSTSSESQKNDTGAQIRQATTQALKNICDPSTKLNRTPIAKTSKRQNEIEDKIADRQRTGLLYQEEDDEPCAKIDHAIQTHKDQISKKQDQSTKGKTQKEDKDKQKKLRDSEVRKDRDQNNKPSRESTAKRTVEKNKNVDKDTKKRPHSEIKNKGEILRPGPVSEEPHTLMQGVVFVLSGYENPRRGSLRTAALSMGARCERDWTHACTHLICAFPNTPKLRQVRASPNGAHVPIAKGEWIEECAARRRLLPWQWFATEPTRHVSPPADYGEHEKTDSECDTDDEIEKVLNKQKKRKLDKSPQNGGSPDVETETSREADMQLSRDERVKNDASEEMDGEDTDVDLDYEQTTKIEEHKGLPNFFEGYTFVIDESVRGCGVDPALLARYVRAYGGLLLQPPNLDEEGDVVVLCGAGGTSNACGKAVRADWVWECHRRKLFCPIQEYQLT